MFNYFAVKFGLAYIIDFILGDPRWLYHPVIIIGKLISFLEKFLYKAKNKIERIIVIHNKSLLKFVKQLTNFFSQKLSSVLP